MAIHRPSENVLVKKDFLTAITAASNTGTAIDCLGYQRAMAIFDTAPTGSGTTSDCKLQECATSGGSFVDVTGATFTQATTVGGATVQVMDIDLSKRLRYLKLVHTGAGGSAAGNAAGLFILFEPTNLPPTQDVAAITTVG